MKKARVLIGCVVYEMSQKTYARLLKDCDECSRLTESTLWDDALNRAVSESTELFVLDGVYNY